MTEYTEREALDKVLTIAAVNGKDKDRRTWAKAICVLHDMPAADVAAVVHGEWIFGEIGPVGCTVKCSACGWGINSVDPVLWVDYAGHNYCGSCGAKMNGVQKMRLIDADKALSEVKPYEASDENWSVTGGTAIRMIHSTVENAPTIDIGRMAVQLGYEQVVHCKDCEYAERYERIDGTAGYYCGHPQNIFTYGEHRERVFKPIKETYDFCSYGVRKDGVSE